MRTYENPFRVRASEFQTADRTFVRNFASGILDLLPERVFDQPFVLRSAPGGGKTSLMRLFTIECLDYVAKTRDTDLDALHERLRGVGALDRDGPRVMGVLVNLSGDYAALVDLDLSQVVTQRLFWRLLNARVMASALQAILGADGLRFPKNADRVTFSPTADCEDALARLGGGSGSALLTTARQAESEILDLLDSLTAVDLQGIDGHGDFYAARVLRDCEILVDGRPVPAKPFVMLDDGHELPPGQREQLYAKLTDRRGGVGIWYAERLVALSQEELLGRSDPDDRTFLRFEIEPMAQDPSISVSRKKANSRWFSKFLLEVGDRRAAWHLHNYAEEIEPFSELLACDDSDVWQDKFDEILAEIHRRLSALTERSERYRGISDLIASPEFRDPVRCRELLIVLERDHNRPQRELFEQVMDERGLGEKSDSRLSAAARLFLAREFKLPYYYGKESVAKLASYNVEQFLRIGGDLFEEMLGAITVGRKPRIAARRQDRLVRQASADLWESIPRRVPYGRDVKDLLVALASMAEVETHKPNAPYAPGVTGTAMYVEEQSKLLRAADQGSDSARRLLQSLRSAIANNLLEVKREARPKNRLVMVLYLNRLLCPRFGLPLERGGFRERHVDQLSRWLEPNPDAQVRQLEL